MAALPTPSGMSPSEFGRKLWGRGPEDAQRKLETITRHELELMGVDCELARYWRDFYRKAAISGRGGESAELRRQLMERCMELLEC